MNKYLLSTIVFLAATSTDLALSAVDKSSDAYKSGGMAANIFMAVLAILIIRKLFFKK